MPDQLQLRGGTTAEHSTFTGASKEVTVDTTKKTAVVHDGTTAGGLPLMREDASNAALALGSVGTPSLKFTGDTNTGIFSPGADTLAFVTGGANRLHITSGGLLGLGTSSPGAKLEVAGDVIFNGGGVQFPIQFANAFTPNSQRADLLFSANATSNNAFRVGTIASNGGVTLQGTRQSNSSQKVNLVLQPDGGSVGIGTTTVDARLLVSDGTNINTRIGQLTLDNFTGEGAGIRFSRTTSDDALCGLGAVNAGDGDLGFFSRNNLIFATGGASNYSATTERARIDNSGRLLVGTTSGINDETGLGVVAAQNTGGAGVVTFKNSGTVQPSSNCLVLIKADTTTSSAARFIQFYCDNTATAMGGIVGNGASNVQFATLSDIRDKENIQPVTNALDKIKEIEVVSYDWKQSKEHVKAGFIAQNIENVFPEYVVENMASDGAEPRKGITGGLSSGYVAVLTAALQEAIAKIESLETRLSALEGN